MSLNKALQFSCWVLIGQFGLCDQSAVLLPEHSTTAVWHSIKQFNIFIPKAIRNHLQVLHNETDTILSTTKNNKTTPWTTHKYLHFSLVRLNFTQRGSKRKQYPCTCVTIATKYSLVSIVSVFFPPLLALSRRYSCSSLLDHKGAAEDSTNDL